MTDATTATPASTPADNSRSLLVRGDRTRRRHAAEARFRMLGLAAVAFGILALVGLLSSILVNGASSFRQTYIALDVYLDPAKLDKSGTGDLEQIKKVSTFGYAPLINAAIEKAVEDNGIAVEGAVKKDITGLISKEAPAEIRRYVIANPSKIGDTVPFNLLANGRIDGYYKGRVTMETAQLDRNVSPAQLMLSDELKEAGVLSTRFNFRFFTAPDASDTRPEAAGLGVAILGSAYMMLVVLGLSLPIGVAASIYLEEFAPQNRLTDIIEVNIANLAAVPSIVFGILGLAVFINYAGLPQSAPVVGGLVLTLMTLPTIIIATRAALKAVPPSIREAALGVGASKMQTIFPSRAAAGRARHSDRRDHRLGPGARRNRPAAADRHGCIRARISRRSAGRVLRSCIRTAGSGVQLDHTRRPGICRARVGCHHCAVGVPCHNEHHGDHPAQTLRTAVVRTWRRVT